MFMRISFLILLSIIAFSGFSFDMNRDTVVEKEGFFYTVYGDPRPISETTAPKMLYVLSSKNNTGVYQLAVSKDTISRAGGIKRLQGKYVRVKGVLQMLPTVNEEERATKLLRANEIVILNKDLNANAIVRGGRDKFTYRWVILLCKFSDIPHEPRPVSYFKSALSLIYPGQNHYWHEASFNELDLDDSHNKVYGWYTLPHDRSYYLNADPMTMLDRLLKDCTAVADTDVDFRSYDGILMAFNDDSFSYAFGGSSYTTLDGESRQWGINWLIAEWSYEEITVIAHEMGHAYGLPHSSAMYGEVYDNPWDVMSDGWYNCSAHSHPIFGCLPQHTIAIHKYWLGWIPDSRAYMVNYLGFGSPSHLTLDTYQLILRVPIQGSSSNYYTVEARQLPGPFVGYDAKLYDSGVVIHKVDETAEVPAKLLDADNNGIPADEGSIWRVGEIFNDGDAKISIEVLAKDASGNFQVQVTNGQNQVTAWLVPHGQLHPFVDVNLYHWAHAWIRRLRHVGVTSGCQAMPPRYCPEAATTRSQMAVFLLRSIHGADYIPPDVSTPPFNDVPLNHWAVDWIAQLKDEGITVGCGGGKYCPGQPVTRSQMAVFLLRSIHGADYIPPDVSTPPFNDVPLNHWAVDWIAQLKDEGITVGCGGGKYCPGQPVTRSQMAVFLIRAFNLP